MRYIFLSVLSFFEKVDRSEFKPLLATVAIATGMQIAYWPLLRVGEQIPDTRLFGFNGNDLKELYDRWDPTCQKAYMQGNTMDLFLLVPSYTITLGSWLYHQAQDAGKPVELSLIFIIAAISDIIETIVLGRACLLHPAVLDERIVLAGSLGQQIKWISLGLGTLLILFNSITSDSRLKLQKNS